MVYSQPFYSLNFRKSPFALCLHFPASLLHLAYHVLHHFLKLVENYVLTQFNLSQIYWRHKSLIKQLEPRIGLDETIMPSRIHTFPRLGLDLKHLMTWGSFVLQHVFVTTFQFSWLLHNCHWQTRIFLSSGSGSGGRWAGHRHSPHHSPGRLRQNCSSSVSKIQLRWEIPAVAANNITDWQFCKNFERHLPLLCKNCMKDVVNIVILQSNCIHIYKVNQIKMQQTHPNQFTLIIILLVIGWSGQFLNGNKDIKAKWDLLKLNTMHDY